MAWPKLSLRMRASPGLDMLELREVCVPAGASLRAMAAFCQAISEPEALSELAARAGMKCGPWGQRSWVEAGWEARGAKPIGEWLALSLRRAKEQWDRKEACGPSEGEWEHGGWMWCEVHGCWMAQVFVVSGGAQARSEQVKMQPAALTIWQWDHDLFDEHRQSELSGSDLVGMCQSMTGVGLREMLGSLKGAFSAPEPAAAQLRALAERGEIEGSCFEGRSGEAARL